MTRVQVLGVDPGPTTGIGIIAPDNIQFVQCHHELAIPLLEWLIAGAQINGLLTVIGQERYVMSLRASKLNNAKAQQITRDVNGGVVNLAHSDPNVRLVEYRAVDWKPWATMERLEKAGINRIAKGSTHARDGIAVGLFVAVHNCGMRDPLSTRPQAPDWVPYSEHDRPLAGPATAAEVLERRP